MAGALSGDDLTAARAELEASWPGTAILSQPGTALDASGGWTEGFTVVGTVAALLHPVAEAEAMVGGRMRGERSYVLSCPATSTIGEGWRVSYAGRTFEVESVRAWGPAEVATRATLSEVSSSAV